MNKFHSILVICRSFCLSKLFLLLLPMFYFSMSFVCFLPRVGDFVMNFRWLFWVFMPFYDLQFWTFDKFSQILIHKLRKFTTISSTWLQIFLNKNVHLFPFHNFHLPNSSHRLPPVSHSLSICWQTLWKYFLHLLIL